MAGPLRADVEMLNRSMENLGQSFAQRRQEEYDRQMRQQLLEREMERQQALQAHYNAEQQHYSNMEEAQSAGKVDTYLQSDDGQGVIHFSGPSQGLDTLIQSAAQKGKKLTPMAGPPQKQPFAVIKTTTPIGDLEFHAQDADQLGKITEQVQKMGGKSQNHQAGQYGPVAADQYATGLENQADALEQQPDTNTPSLDAQVAKSKVVQGLRTRAAAIRSGIGKQPAQPTEEVETQTGLPGQPPTQKIIRRGPVGSIPSTAPEAVPGVPGVAPDAPANPSQRSIGKQYKTPKGVFTWGGSGWIQ